MPVSFDQLVDDSQKQAASTGAPIQAFAQRMGYDVDNLPANIVDQYNKWMAIQPVAPPTHVLTPQEEQLKGSAIVNAPEALQNANAVNDAESQSRDAEQEHLNAVQDDPMEGYTDVPKMASGGPVSFDQMQDDSAGQPQQTAAPGPQVPSFDSLQDDSEKYSTPSQQLRAGIEGVAKGVAGPLAPYLEHKLFRTPKADILGREQANPITSGAGQAAGLVGGALTGVGEGALMEGAGKLATEAAGLAKPVSYASKVGSAAVQQAAEMAVLQSGDEASKMILQDPETSAQSAIANVGLATLLGGAGGAFFTGAVSPLWKATVGDRLAEGLTTLTQKLGGVEGAVQSDASKLAEQSGIKLAPELIAKMDGGEFADNAFSTLSQSDHTIAGRALQKNLDEGYGQIREGMLNTLGHDSSYLEKMPDLDKYSTGRDLGESLATELKPKIEDLSNRYDSFENEFKGAKVSNPNVQAMSDQVAQLALDQGWHKAAEDTQQKLAEKVMTKLPQLENANDLKMFLTNLRESHPYGTPTYQAAKDISKIIADGQGRAVTEGIIAKGGEAGNAEARLAEYGQLRKDYATTMNHFDDLNTHLHVGRYNGPKGFVNALEEKASAKGENLLNQMSGEKNAQLLDLLSQSAPETLAKVRQYHVDKLLTKAGDSPTKILKGFDGLSPQLKNLIVSPEGQRRLQNLGQVMEKLQDATHNFSNTARTNAKLGNGEHGSTALTYLAAMLGHAGPAVAASIGKLGITEGRDAIKLGMMKFLGSDQPVKSEAFKAMVGLMHNTIQGENMLAKGSAAVFKSGAQVLTDKMMPSKEDRTKLDKIVEKSQSDPNYLISKTTKGDIGHYLPAHQEAMTRATAQQVQYLASLKPKGFKPGPLDREIPPSTAQVSRYNRALDIANQPMVVLQHIKDGTLQPSDMHDLRTLSPQLYNSIAQKLSNNMINAANNGETIPYQTRMGISLFLGQPVDLTMTPQGIMAAQPKPQAPQQAPEKPMKGRKGKSAIDKVGSEAQTPLQSAESDMKRD